MSIDPTMSDQAILRQIGERLAHIRLSKDLTQQAVAEQAGMSLRTLQRLESGEAATQLSGVIRLCRALGILEQLDLFIPPPTPSPMQLLKLKGKERQRASGKDLAVKEERKPWTWAE